MIIDTDVLIWFLRGNEKAVNEIINAGSFSLSIITYMELLQGMRNKQEMEQMKKSFDKMGITEYCQLTNRFRFMLLIYLRSIF